MSPGPLPRSVCGSGNEASLPSGFDQLCLGGGYISKHKKGTLQAEKIQCLSAYYRLTIHHPVKLFMLVPLLGTITLGVHRVYLVNSRGYETLQPQDRQEVSLYNFRMKVSLHVQPQGPTRTLMAQ